MEPRSCSELVDDATELVSVAVERVGISSTPRSSDALIVVRFERFSGCGPMVGPFLAGGPTVATHFFSIVGLWIKESKERTDRVKKSRKEEKATGINSINTGGVLTVH